MPKALTTILSITILLLLAACGQRGKSSCEIATQPIELSYASYLRLAEGDGFTIAEVINPWDSTKILHTYILTDGKKEIPHIEGTLVRTPLSRSLVYSSVHGSLVVQLGQLEAIKGMCDLNYVLQPDILAAIVDGDIADMGGSMNPNIEAMIDLQPDAVLLSPYDDSSGYGRVSQLGIPIIECADYMETSPLGRAEWIKFYALLYGVGEEGNQLFKEIEERYLALKALAQGVNERPTVLCEMMDGAIWYVPGGESTKGVLLRDAGADYVFAHEARSGSLAFSFEKVLDQAAEADYWFVNYNKPKGEMDYAELLAHNPRYAQFEAVSGRTVYGCNTSITAYYEEYPFNPDRLLRNFVQIFHPTLLPSEDLLYFCKLKE